MTRHQESDAETAEPAAKRAKIESASPRQPLNGDDATENTSPVVVHAGTKRVRRHASRGGSSEQSASLTTTTDGSEVTTPSRRRSARIQSATETAAAAMPVPAPELAPRTPRARTSASVTALGEHDIGVAASPRTPAAPRGIADDAMLAVTGSGGGAKVGTRRTISRRSQSGVDWAGRAAELVEVVAGGLNAE
ncbi:hypothetical protein BC828DRAFT_392363 [Blastocladiella britannica]|nr:hypothetical protein BC828DRAFT_392363 [Blastocladiella britannica]